MSKAEQFAKAVERMEFPYNTHGFPNALAAELRALAARVAELEDINARLAGDMQEPREYTLHDAIRIGRLWRAGKLIGGDPQGVINALLTAIPDADGGKP